MQYSTFGIVAHIGEHTHTHIYIYIYIYIYIKKEEETKKKWCAFWMIWHDFDR
jgi:hypothetical protein